MIVDLRLRPFLHVRKRLWQRYCMRIWPAEFQVLCRGLASGRYPSRLVDGQSGDPRVLITFTYARRMGLAVCVWDQVCGLLVTTLPLNSRSRAHIARAFLLGTGQRTVDAAIRAGARTNDQWLAFLDGCNARFWSGNGKRARRKVICRHPVEVSGAATS